jgi:voltage-gated potassium channel
MDDPLKHWQQHWSPWRRRLHEIIFGAEDPAGKLFDIVLLLAILASVAAVLLDSIESIHAEYGSTLLALEWCFTILFTIEYLLRLIAVRHPAHYARSFFGIIDLLAILPTYLMLILPGAQTLVVIRALRLLRVFRIFKLMRFMQEGDALRRALWQSRTKITVFLVTVIVVVLIMGSAMYLVEGLGNPDTEFTSIPQSMYWAIVTMTTVGYGDISPTTPLGKFFAATIMIFGYSLIIVPTGIVSAEFSWGRPSERKPKGSDVEPQSCPVCLHSEHADEARFCHQCGAALAATTAER